MAKSLLNELGDILFITKKHNCYSTFLPDLIKNGKIEYKVKKSKTTQIEHLVAFLKDLSVTSLVIEEINDATITEHGYHSGSWDVPAYGVVISFPLSPALKILYDKKK